MKSFPQVWETLGRLETDRGHFPRLSVIKDVFLERIRHSLFFHISGVGSYIYRHCHAKYIAHLVHLKLSDSLQQERPQTVISRVVSSAHSGCRSDARAAYSSASHGARFVNLHNSTQQCHW